MGREANVDRDGAARDGETMRRLVQEERSPSTGARAGGWGMNGRQEVVQDTLNKRWRRGQTGLRVGMVLAFIASGRRGFHTVLPCPHLLPISLREVFEPTVERGELVVRYRVRKSYSRRTTEATCK